MGSGEIIGFLAAFLASIAAVPQVYKTWKTKEADDLSYLTLIFLLSEMVLWLLYGINLHSIPMYISNTVAILALSSIIILKFKYKNLK